MIDLQNRNSAASMVVFQEFKGGYPDREIRGGGFFLSSFCHVVLNFVKKKTKQGKKREDNNIDFSDSIWIWHADFEGNFF